MNRKKCTAVEEGDNNADILTKLKRKTVDSIQYFWAKRTSWWSLSSLSRYYATVYKGDKSYGLLFALLYIKKILVTVPRKCHNREAQSSRGTKRRRDEEQIMTKQTPHMKKRVREKSRECNNHTEPQPFPDTKRKRKQTKPNKRTKSTTISSLFPKRGNRNAKRTEKKYKNTRKYLKQIAS